MFLELISTAIFSARKIQVKKITFLPFWAVFAQNLGNFGKIFQKKFAPIFFSSFRTTGENFSQNGDPHVTRGPLMVHSLVHPLLSRSPLACSGISTQTFLTPLCPCL